MTEPIDAAVTYLTAPPTPQPKPSGSREIDDAWRRLQSNAAFVTAPEPVLGDATARWAPGMAIAVVVRDGEGQYRALTGGFGVKDVNGAEAPDADTLFPCASLSKPVSSTVIALRAGGDANWDAVVEQRDGSPYTLAHLPATASPPLLRQWLSHRSGLPDHSGDLIEDLWPEVSRDALLDNVMRYQTGLTPGVFNYTNFGYTMGCLGAAHVLDPSQTWEQFAAAGLHDLGMTTATYEFTSVFDPGAGNRAVPHLGNPLGVPNGSPSRRQGWIWQAVDRAGERNPSRQAPAGSLLASVNDLAAFLEVHLSGRFGPDFPPRNPPPEDLVGHAYSLGWNVANLSSKPPYKGACNAVSFSHSGAFALGAATCLRFDPDAGVGVAILTNGQPTGLPELLVRLFFNDLYGQPIPPELLTDGSLDVPLVLDLGRAVLLQLFDARADENFKLYSRRAPAPLPSNLTKQSEVFRGHSLFYGCDVTISRAAGGDLSLGMGSLVDGQPIYRFPLRCIAADAVHNTATFVYATVGENAASWSPITLTLRDSDGVGVEIFDAWLDQTPPEADHGSGVGVIQASS